MTSAAGLIGPDSGAGARVGWGGGNAEKYLTVGMSAEFVGCAAHVSLSVCSGTNISGRHVLPDSNTVRLNDQFLLYATIATVPWFGEQRGRSGEREKPKGEDAEGICFHFEFLSYGHTRRLIR